MPLSSYDSPTFLGQKDKYLVGLTLPQLMLSMGVGGLWFLFTLLLPYTMLVKLMVMIPATAVTVALLFVRIWGLSVPMLVALAIQRMMSKPMYEEFRELLILGAPEWVEEQREKAGRGGLLGFLRRRRALAQDPDVEARKAEVKAEGGPPGGGGSFCGGGVGAGWCYRVHQGRMMKGLVLGAALLAGALLGTGSAGQVDAQGIGIDACRGVSTSDGGGHCGRDGRAERSQFGGLHLLLR